MALACLAFILFGLNTTCVSWFYNYVILNVIINQDTRSKSRGRLGAKRSPEVGRRFKGGSEPVGVQEDGASQGLEDLVFRVYC